MAFTLPPLPYASDALAPHIDAQTMRIHYEKHHGTYVSKLNDAIANSDKANLPLEKLIRAHHSVAAIRNNGGGHWNHSFFWASMSPTGGGEPVGAIAEAIQSTFGSFDHFKEQFTQAALTRFGSGWAWLCLDDTDKLCICSTANQDNPLMECSDCPCCTDGKGKPLLGLDVWEHAYYLRYQNRRPEYVAAFFQVINWNKVGQRLAG